MAHKNPKRIGLAIIGGGGSAVYSLEIGVVGTEGVLTIGDTHRDIPPARE